MTGRERFESCPVRSVALLRLLQRCPLRSDLPIAREDHPSTRGTPELLEGACSESVSKDDEPLSGHGAVPGVRDIEFTNDD